MGGEKDAAVKVRAIMAGVQKEFVKIPQAVIFPFNIPALSGFGASSGFNFLLQDRSGTLTVQQLGDQAQEIHRSCQGTP